MKLHVREESYSRPQGSATLISYTLHEIHEECSNLEMVLASPADIVLAKGQSVEQYMVWALYILLHNREPHN